MSAHLLEWSPGLPMHDGRNIDCVHVDCAGGACRYRPDPPAIGPMLPRQVRDALGGLWTRQEGLVYYHAKPGGGYDLVLWRDLVQRRPLIRSAFPFDAGPWEVALP